MKVTVEYVKKLKDIWFEGTIVDGDNDVDFNISIAESEDKMIISEISLHKMSAADGCIAEELFFKNHNGKLFGQDYVSAELTPVDGWMGISIEDISKELLKACYEYLQTQIQELQKIHSQIFKIGQ